MNLLILLPFFLLNILIVKKNQFHSPYPKGRKLIFFTPFMGGANEENQ